MVFMRYKDCEGSQKEAWGERYAIMDVAERQIWVETLEGYRLPRTYLETNSRSRNAVLKAPFLLTPEEVVLTARGTLLLQEENEKRL